MKYIFQIQTRGALIKNTVHSLLNNYNDKTTLFPFADNYRNHYVFFNPSTVSDKVL